MKARGKSYLQLCIALSPLHLYSVLPVVPGVSMGPNIVGSLSHHVRTEIDPVSESLFPSYSEFQTKDK
jgi:hypothetical protein